MITFPALKTGAVMQYPATKSIDYRNQVLRFLDGAEQRYRDCKSALHTWVVRLDLLDETEMNSLEQFFLSRQGVYGSFSFVDPWDNTPYPDCSLDNDVLDLKFYDIARGTTSVVIRENRT
jgi:phage-related protein